MSLRLPSSRTWSSGKVSLQWIIVTSVLLALYFVAIGVCLGKLSPSQEARNCSVLFLALDAAWPSWSSPARSGTCPTAVISLQSRILKHGHLSISQVFPAFGCHAPWSFPCMLESLSPCWVCPGSLARARLFRQLGLVFPRHFSCFLSTV